ncbi:LLM class flavin-dependent oxidoreductase [Chachezhania antarctica]|uniref:LLM class flavin-dependent oxidoreductase n=1 Tax=Chachezhania antarctica TaxID=2340860 RepID=UPI000EAE78F9|nr:LLM class flavin-dependent oxidoreductase [Chachezhania antarctica]
MHNYSILDLAPVPEGGTVSDALDNTVELARAADRLGYHRYWLAEHHNMSGIASAATAVVIGRVAGATDRIRVGAGGVMLPNHPPLVIAEQFGTLDAMYPGRIDLGLGRAPGTDQATAQALRRYFQSADRFPDDVAELLGYLGDAEPNAKVRAVPGEGSHVPVWILGSSLFGAQFAAHMGLPYAFASHFAPQMLGEALEVYRAQFRPSAWLARPYAMMAAGVFAADTAEEARYLRSSQLLAFARLRMGRPGKLPMPVEDVEAHVPAPILAQAEAALSCSACGAAADIERQIASLVETFQPDELMITSAMHDPAARIRSITIAAGVLAGMTEESHAAE